VAVHLVVLVVAVRLAIQRYLVAQHLHQVKVTQVDLVLVLVMLQVVAVVVVLVQLVAMAELLVAVTAVLA
jgi:hypothetical protein